MRLDNGAEIDNTAIVANFKKLTNQVYKLIIWYG